MMRSTLPQLLAFALLAFSAHAQEQAAPPEAPAPEAQAPQIERSDAPEAANEDRASADDEDDRERGPRWSSRDEDVVLHIGEDAVLKKGEHANAVLAVFGDAIVEGDVHDAAVAIFGNVRVSGAVGDSVGAIFGNAAVDGPVGGEAFALLGDLTLGPNAVVDGDVGAVGGRILRDAQAVVHGNAQEIAIAGNLIRVDWLRAWVRHCLLLGRPLALEPGLGWAWSIAFGFLAFYVLLAVLFGDAMHRCVQTLETRPGESVLAALLSVLATPVLFVLLIITMIGMILVPFLAIALFFVGLFGKAVVLAWMGRRVARFTGLTMLDQIALAVLVGGVLMMALYLVPVLGFIVYKVGGILGMGVVIYTILLLMQARRASPAVAAAAPAGANGPVLHEAAGSGLEGVAAATPATAADAIPPVNTHLLAPRAGFWIRMGALLIDVLLVSIVTAVLQAPGEIWLIALAGYGALMWKLKGTTIGGIVCHLQIVRVDGREIEWDTALVRALSAFLSLAPAGLGFIWIAFDSERQAWHDKIAGTVVVRLPKAAPVVAHSTT
jgi:uncharacterized RDD family membrane protein YckC